MTEELIKLRNRIRSLEKENEVLRRFISESESCKLVIMEKIKSDIWKSIITSNTDIKLPDVIDTDDKDMLEIFPLYVANPDIVIDKYLRQSRPKSRPKSRSRSRPRPETKLVLESLEDLSEKDVIQTYIKLLDKLESTRTYTKELEKIKRLRYRSFSELSYDKYVELLETHYTNLERILSCKKIVTSKIPGLIKRSLTALEIRLLSRMSFPDVSIESDDLDLLSSITTPKFTEMELYNSTKVCNYFNNYSIALFSISDLLEKYLNSNDGYVYVEMDKSTSEDAYSFYELEKVTKNKRHWKMDCRAEDYTTVLANNIQSFLIYTYRELYFKVYGHNDYKSCFHSQLLEDGEQLLLNIELICNFSKFNKLVRNTLVGKCKYQLSSIDKLNLKSDDILQRQRFMNLEVISLGEIYNKLFDSLQPEELDEILLLRKT